MNKSIINPHKIGKLLVLATPIGNLADFTFRAVEVLKNAKYVFCEDTRHSLPMLKHFGISSNCRLISLYEYNQQIRVNKALLILESGEDIVLISDAGTPTISDPGAIFINALREHGINIIPIPGACAAISAYSVSGIISDGFCFRGFLSDTPKELNYEINQIFNSDLPTIIYEAPHRLSKTIKAFAKIFSADKKIFIAREISKIYEEYNNLSLQELITRLENKELSNNRGEWVLIIPAQENIKKLSDINFDDLENNINDNLMYKIAEKIKDGLKDELPPAKLAKIIHQITGLQRQEVYNYLTKVEN